MNGLRRESRVVLQFREHRTIVLSIHRELIQTVAKDPVSELVELIRVTWRSTMELVLLLARFYE